MDAGRLTGRGTKTQNNSKQISAVELGGELILKIECKNAQIEFGGEVR
jgi:hypothetical protein